MPDINTIGDNSQDAAFAAADQQIAHVDTTLERLVDDARSLIAEHGDTMAWAKLSVVIDSNLSDRTQFMAQLLSRMAIKEATR